jgi:Asp-tRNA(Asn)/Glu-tRNA(Gln) amidotransferase A subunit family amidase
VLEAAAALAAAGHDVVPWDPAARAGVDLRAAALGYGALVGSDSIAEMKAATQGEALNRQLYGRFAAMARIPTALGIRRALGAALRALGYPRLADILHATRVLSMRDSWRWNAERKCAKDALVDGMRAAGLHALLSPGMGTPAWPHGAVANLEAATSYAWVWNYFHFPAGVVPVTTVREDECYYEAPRSQQDCIARAAAAAMRGAMGLPVGVQLCGLPWQDELVLRAMRELEAALDAQDGGSAAGRWRQRGCPEQRVQAAVAAAGKFRAGEGHTGAAQA